MTDEKFCSGCRRYKPDAQIYSKKVTVLRRGKAINYLCVACEKTIRARTEKSRLDILPALKDGDS